MDVRKSYVTYSQVRDKETFFEIIIWLCVVMSSLEFSCFLDLGMFIGIMHILWAYSLELVL